MLNGLVPRAGRRPLAAARAVWRSRCGSPAGQPARCAPRNRRCARCNSCVHADHSNTARARLGNCDLRATECGDIADLVAAIDDGGDRRLANDPHGGTRLRCLVVLGDRQDARQAGEAIAAQRIVDQLVGDDHRLVRRIADPLQRRLAQRPRRLHAEANAAGAVGVEHSASLERTGRPLFGEGARRTLQNPRSGAAWRGSPGAARRAIAVPGSIAARESWTARRVVGSAPPPRPRRAQSASARPSAPHARSHWQRVPPRP